MPGGAGHLGRWRRESQYGCLCEVLRVRRRTCEFGTPWTHDSDWVTVGAAHDRVTSTEERVVGRLLAGVTRGDQSRIYLVDFFSRVNSKSKDSATGVIGPPAVPDSRERATIKVEVNSAGYLDLSMMKRPLRIGIRDRETQEAVEGD